MIALLDTSEDLKVCAEELGCEVLQLFTPLTRFAPQDPEAMFAIDNGAFSNFSIKGFEALIERESERRELCIFVACPDVVASARRTLELFDHWMPRLDQWPLALVAQDGQEDLPIPWEHIEAIFIGGTTEWKMSKAAADVIKTGHAMEKWVHVGRVNRPGRFEYFEKLGADSIDGTGISRFSWMRHNIWKAQHEPHLFSEHEGNHSELSG